MMKGDDHCHFRWLMPPNATISERGEPSELGERLSDDYRATSEVEAAWKALKRSNRLLGGNFSLAPSPSCSAMARKGVRLCVTPWQLGVPNVIRYLPSVMSKKASRPVREVEVTTTKVIVEIDETPQDEAFEDSKHSELGSLWYQHSYPAMAAAYLPGATAQWTRLRARGDETNRLELHCGEMEK